MKRWSFYHRVQQRRTGRATAVCPPAGVFKDGWVAFPPHVWFCSFGPWGHRRANAFWLRTAAGVSHDHKLRSRRPNGFKRRFGFESPHITADCLSTLYELCSRAAEAERSDPLAGNARVFSPSQFEALRRIVAQ